MADKIFLGHTTARIKASVTRPSNANAYAAGDVIGTAASDVIAFPNLARSNGGAGMIINAVVVDSASQATKPSLELWLFTVAPAAVADNAAFAPTDAELENLVGVIDLTSVRVGNATVGAGGNSVLPSAVSTLPFKCEAGSTTLYGVLVVRNAYTPVADEKFTVILNALQDY